MARGDGPTEADALLPPSPTSPGQHYIRRAVSTSIFVNLALFFAKLWACYASHSLAIVASMLDSFLDLVSQLIIWHGYRFSRRPGKAYPVGRTRLSPVGILVCATVMFAAAVEIIKQSAFSIHEGYEGAIPRVHFNLWVVLTLVVATGLKLVLYVFSRYHPSCARSPDVQTIADDHRNDVLTNLLALGCGSVATWRRSLWAADPLGAMVLAVYIAYSWYKTGRQSMRKLVGVEADRDLVFDISQRIARFQSRNAELDWLRCYHLGNNVIVEVEIVMPDTFTLQQTADIAALVRMEIEELSVVERAYVHVDYERRDYDEHKLRTLPVGYELRSPVGSQNLEFKT